MLSSIFVALLQAAAGDPASGPAAETPAAEAPAAASQSAPRTERRRVCRAYEAVTGGRLSQRRCRWEEVQVGEGDASEAPTAEASPPAAEDAVEQAADSTAGSTPAATAPTAPH